MHNMNPLKIWIVSCCIALGTSGCGQSKDRPVNNDPQFSKYEAFLSNTGAQIRMQDYKLPPLKLDFGEAKAKLRKMERGKQREFFLILAKAESYNDEPSTAIAFDDLIEIEKALAILKDELPADAAAEPTYLENRYVTADGLQVGYYCEGTKAQWYISFSHKGSVQLLRIKESLSLDILINQTKTQVKSLKRGKDHDEER